MTVSWEISELSGGLRVVTTPVPTSQSVSVNVFVGAGSRGESERTKGIAHFVEHMLFKGTPRRPTAIDVAEAIEGAGGVLNAYTSKEMTCYWNHVPYDALEQAIDVLADMFHNSLLDADEIERERSVVQQEIRRTHDQPSAFVGELLGRAVYGDQHLGWSTAGTEETVAAIRQDDFTDWLGTWYGSPNVVVSVAGNTDHRTVSELVQNYFGNGRSERQPAMPALDGEMPAARVVSDSRDITQMNLALGLPAFSRSDPDRYALIILNSVLGRGMSSRLFKEVRERRGLAYSVGSSASRHSDTGMFVVSAGVSPENGVEAVSVILSELQKLVEEPVGNDELTKATDYAIGSFRLSLESTMSLGQRAGENLLTLDDIEPIESVVEKLRAITPDDVRRVAGRIFVRERAALGIVGPAVDEAAFMDVLAA
jgi:predicted Zn-dependent peptidase